MDDKIDTKRIEQIRTAVAAWVNDTFATDEVILGEIAEDNEDYEGEEDAVRYLVKTLTPFFGITQSRRIGLLTGT